MFNLYIFPPVEKSSNSEHFLFLNYFYTSPLDFLANSIAKFAAKPAGNFTMRSQAVNILAIASLSSLISAHPHSDHSSPKPRILASRQFDAGDMYANWPSYDQLPLDPSYPTKAAWGVWVIHPSHSKSERG
jgi:hypothetical protein